MNPMRLVCISKIRDESDILESFIRHHLRMVDHMIIMDHRSTDGSGDILRQHEGETLTVVKNTDPAHEQSSCLTRLMNMAIQEHEADWVIPLDADEFLRTEHNLQDILAKLPTDTIKQIPWQTYVPVGDCEGKSPKKALLNIPYRRDYEPGQFYKILIPAALVDYTSIIYEGSHGIYNAASQLPLPMEKEERLAIAHFPVRSEAQLRQKIQNACEARAKLAGHFASGRSFHLQELQRILEEKPVLSPDDLLQIALWYAAPVYRDGRVPTLVHDPLPAI